MSVEVAGQYPDIPVQPEPSFWCGFGELLRPGASGAAASPLLLAEEATVGSVAPGASQLWELHPDPTHLTRDSADQLVRDFEGLVATAASLNASVPTPIVADHTSPTLAQLIDQADDVGQAVGRSVAFLGVGGAADRRRPARARRAPDRSRTARRADAAERFAANERVDWRYASPRATCCRRWSGPRSVSSARSLAVRSLGPAPELETGPLLAAIILAAIGMIAGVAVVSCGGRRGGQPCRRSSADPAAPGAGLGAAPRRARRRKLRPSRSRRWACV